MALPPPKKNLAHGRWSLGGGGQGRRAPRTPRMLHPWGGRGEGAPGDLPGSFLGAAFCHRPHLPPATTLILLPLLTLSRPRGVCGGARSLPTAPRAQFSNSASS